jgi:hypothetical protein
VGQALESALLRDSIGTLVEVVGRSRVSHGASRMQSRGTIGPIMQYAWLPGNKCCICFFELKQACYPCHPPVGYAKWHEGLASREGYGVSALGIKQVCILTSRRGLQAAASCLDTFHGLPAWLPSQCCACRETRRAGPCCNWRLHFTPAGMGPLWKHRSASSRFCGQLWPCWRSPRRPSSNGRRRA